MMLFSAAVSGAVLTPFQEKVALAVVGAGALGAVVTAVSRSLSEAVSHRREGYAAAIQTLVAWREFPYRVRRRTSDAPEELARLASLGHDLQERLTSHQTWINSECPWLGGRYKAAIETISKRAKDFTNAAWLSKPVKKPEGMNLGGWGPGSCLDVILPLQLAVSTRFGWRRALGPLSPLRIRWALRVIRNGSMPQS